MTTIRKIVVATALVSLVGIASLEAAVRDGTQEVVGQSASGVITGLTGAPLLGTVGGATRGLSLGDTVAVAEELRTGQDDILEILWDRRSLILIQPQSKVLIHESKTGQTEVSLRGGSVRVALAYGGRPTDMVTVQTPSSRVFTRGGILEVDVLPPPPSLFSRVASAFSKAGAPIGQTPLETVRVLEGQSGIEPLTSTSPGQSQMLEAGVQARIAVGMVEQVAELPRNSAKGVGLADTDRRQGTPGPLRQRLVNVHINHALEVERLMSASAPSIDRSGTATGSDLKGAIVATSLGVPTISLAQPGTTSGPVAPVPSPGMTSPLPTLPPVQVPTITTLAPGQSGGFNSRNLLKEILDDDDDKGGGRNRGRDRDRDD